MGRLSFLFSKTERPYTGAELRPHFLLSELGLRGSGIAAFIGPCQVQTDSLVDWEDRLNKDFIQARLMVHFLGEFFGISLREGVLCQRLFMASIAETLNEALGSVARDGDDLYFQNRKLTVSIVTSSPVSQLLHVGINLDPAGAPVAAVGLFELGFDRAQIEERFVPALLERFTKEWESVEFACTKVRPVV